MDSGQFPSATAIGATKTQPRAFIPGPVEAVLTSWAIQYGPVAARFLATNWDGARSLFAHLESSIYEDPYFHVRFTLQTVAPHALYIESLAIVDPEGVDLELMSTEYESIRLGSGRERAWYAPEEVFPLQMASAAKALTLHCRFKDSAPSPGRLRIGNRKTVRLGLWFQRLDRDGVEPLRIDIALRRNRAPVQGSALTTR